MEDFFDDFDWEDMAMIGSMADEFAEEKRDRRRWEREEYLDPEDEFDFDNGYRRRPVRPRYTRKIPRRKPFEQYADDVAHGRKSHHDPLFGPAKYRRGLSGGPAIFTDTVLYGVKAKNAHLVSENSLRFICTVFYGYPDQELESIVFDPDGQPVIDGHEVFATFDRNTRTIIVNLRRHFANAIRVAEHGYTGFSIPALIWTGLVGSFLHEFKHTLDAYEIGYMDTVPRAEQERVADQWAAEAKTYFARQEQAEMPELSEEPYFGPLVNKYLERFALDNTPEWIQNQREMITAGIFYRNKTAGIEIYSMQEFYESSYRGLDGDEFGRRLNAGLKAQQGLEEEIWKREEMSELALNQAISNSRIVRISHADADGKILHNVVTPQEISTKDYYLWVRAIDRETKNVLSIRVDRIQEVVFLA